MASSTRSSSMVSRVLPLGILAALGLALAGCGGDSIDGAPECDAKKIGLTGQVGTAAIDVSASFSGGLEQKSGGTLKGTLGDGNGTISLTWPTVVADGDQTPVSGQLSLKGVQGGAICVGGDSVLEVESAGSTTFHLTSITNCASGGSIPGDIYGCVGF